MDAYVLRVPDATESLHLDLSYPVLYLTSCAILREVYTSPSALASEEI